MTSGIRVLGWPAFSNRKEQPYTALLYSAMAGVAVAEASTLRVASGRYDILHLHWPDRRIRSSSLASAVLRSVGLLALLDLARARRMKIVWTVHNLAAHDGTHRPWLEERYWRALTKRLDAVICLSESSAAAVRRRHPSLRDKALFVFPHGHMRGVYPDDISREGARAVLGIGVDSRVVAFIGQIRRYKNVPALMQAFRALDDRAAVLLIAGWPRPESLRASIEAIAKSDARIRVDLRFIPDDELQVYLRAADLVVLNYEEVLNSGSAILALSFDRPVLVPAKGAMADLEAQIGPDWVRTYDGVISAELLRDGLEWAMAARHPPRPDLSELDRNRIAGQTADAFRHLAGRC